jgi:hypothetical protein
MTVRQIIIEWLKSNGYDGLFNRRGECGCDIEDLCPCYASIDECEPGYKGRCTDGAEDMCEACAEDPAGWHIGETRRVRG